MSQAPVAIVVMMGVSGAGKTAVGRRLAARLGWPFKEGDELHPAANIAKMSSGTPLTDADRAPWLESVADWIDGWRRARTSGVITCSALKRAYRRNLARGRPDVHFVYLRGDAATLSQRLARRQGHFMPPALLASQLAALEAPMAEEGVVTVEVDQPIARQVEAIARWLRTMESGCRM
jgi:carbohydrate kinase (thermoresistant glucokinase family)